MKDNDILMSMYPKGLFVCPICRKEFEADDNTRYIIGGGFVCSWKCFSVEDKRRNAEKKEKELLKQNNKK